MALAPFDVLSGFRTPEADRGAVRPPRRRRCRGLRAWSRRLEREGLADTFWALWDLDGPSREALVAATGAAATAVAADRGRWAHEAAWAVRLAEQHPGDAGVVVALLLNLLRLDPGQAMFVPAGRLHAYLHGVGIEVMASSDNVVRGGLTTKHVDLGSWRPSSTCAPRRIEPLAAAGHPAELRYPVPAPEFAVVRLAPGAGERVVVEPHGPEILLCVARPRLRRWHPSRAGRGAVRAGVLGPLHAGGAGHGVAGDCRSGAGDALRRRCGAGA